MVVAFLVASVATVPSLQLKRVAFSGSQVQGGCSPSGVCLPLEERTPLPAFPWGSFVDFHWQVLWGSKVPLAIADPHGAYVDGCSLNATHGACSYWSIGGTYQVIVLAPATLGFDVEFNGTYSIGLLF